MYWRYKLGDLLSPPSQPPSRCTFKFENQRSESLTSYLDLEFKVKINILDKHQLLNILEIQSRPRCLVAAPMV